MTNKRGFKGLLQRVVSGGGKAAGFKTTTAKRRNASLSIHGVDDGTRTRDSQNHNLELYQLSYAHHEILKGTKIQKRPSHSKKNNTPLFSMQLASLHVSPKFLNFVGSRLPYPR